MWNKTDPQKTHSYWMRAETIRQISSGKALIAYVKLFTILWCLKMTHANTMTIEFRVEHASKFRVPTRMRNGCVYMDEKTV